jgi:hypothetical protein
MPETSTPAGRWAASDEAVVVASIRRAESLYMGGRVDR